MSVATRHPNIVQMPPAAHVLPDIRAETTPVFRAIPARGDVIADLVYSEDFPASPSSSSSSSPSPSSSSSSSSEKWFININADADSGKRKQNFREVVHSSVIHDLRGHEHETSIHSTGFQAVHSPSAFTNEWMLAASEQEIIARYYAEVESVLKAHIPNAARIVFFDHTVRRVRTGEVDDSASKRQPVLRVHVDQTPKSAQVRVQRHAAHVRHSRVMLINVWRPLVDKVCDFPLAVADARSIDVIQDLVPTTLVYPRPLPDGETYSVRFNPQHRWAYWSHMNHDEVLFLKCYDSASQALASVKESRADNIDVELLQNVAGLTPHTAFFDKDNANNAPSRQSIEVRALVFFD